MSGIFDSKVFNSEVFGKYVGTVSDLKRNELLKAKVFNERTDLKSALKDQVGGNYITIPMKAPIGGTADNYDGSSNITDDTRKTYSQGAIVVGRAHSWTERDFSYDITGGEDFLPIASEVAHYFDGVDQDTLLSILKGIFSMTGGTNATFVSTHTNDISASTTANMVDATTLNSTIQKACGDNKNAFSVVIMHSVVATNLENLNLLNYLKYTDANGVQRDLSLGTWNGKLVLIDDAMPVTPASGSVTYDTYTTYVLGVDAFTYVDAGAKVPYEMERDGKTHGGETSLIARQRKLFAPMGISFAPATIPVSPTATQLETGSSWKVANNGTDYFPIKAIPIARIISRG